MELITRRFLLAPILIVLAIIAADKILLIPFIQERVVYWKKIEPSFYESRNHLFEQLQSRYPEYQKEGKKLGLILGTSRSGEFSSVYISKKIPGSVTYNFSAPFASPSFHYYWLHRILEKKNHIDYVIMEADPILFSPRSVSYSLSYSYDPLFVLTHTDPGRNLPSRVWRIQGRGFSLDEAETFFLKHLFALYQFPLNLANIEENMKEILIPDGSGGFRKTTGFEMQKHLAGLILQANDQNLGGIPNPIHANVTPGEMERDAENSFQLLQLNDFHPAPTQIIFFKMLLKELADHQIPVVLYWPVSAPPLRAMMDRDGITSSVRGAMDGIVDGIKREDPGSWIRIVDPQSDPRLACRGFADSYHLSGACYSQLTDLLIDNLPPQIHRPAPASSR